MKNEIEAASSASATSAWPEQAQQQNAPDVAPQPALSVASSGRRQVFRDLKRSLTEEELSNPGTQKLILEMLANAEDDRDEYRSYVSRFYGADKQVAILGEQLRANKLNEIMFLVGFGVGCAIIGLAPYLWNPATMYGQFCLAVGAVLAAGFTFARVKYAMKL